MNSVFSGSSVFGSKVPPKKELNENNKIECNKLILYHGSDKIVKNPEYGKGAIYNDYGQGFYCTEDKHEADLWASDKGLGYTNKYILDLNGLKVLHLDKDNVLQWASILTYNRTLVREDGVSGLSFRGKMNLEKLHKKYGNVDLKDYDVVIGYRADDSYFSFMKSFINGDLTLEYLKQAMELGKLGYQVALVSEKAFNNLKFVESELINDKSLTDEYRLRDKIARNTYKDFEKKSYYSKYGFIGDFID